MSRTVHGIVALGLVLVACSGVGSTSGTSPAPQAQAEVTSPSSGMHVTASIAAVTLGEECGGGGESKVAPTQCDAGADGSSDHAGCGGTSYCQQSNVQLAFTMGAGPKGATIAIVRVDLLDASGSVVDTLTASKPQLWSGSGYAGWDEVLKPASEAKTSYNLTAPAWSRLDSARSYSAKYKLHVTLRIDGVEVTLESVNLSREPAVAT